MPATGPRVSWRVSASRRLMHGTYSVSTATQRLHAKMQMQHGQGRAQAGVSYADDG